MAKHYVLRFIALTSLLLLVACAPAATPDPNALERVQRIDLLQLPNADWQLSKGSLQLSFCRNRINDALLATAEELNRWRLVQQSSAFPESRERGLAELAALYDEHNVLLWQEWGTVSSQSYRIVVQQGATPSLLDALARLGRDERICFSEITNLRED
ncbi:hypothetical protein ACFOD1_03560 [Pseudidiomarina halophila]|uniref:Uncharacterized protein n=1 Tax=Pseudidiomarina halophila TaxID=1449799 RepID=A0A432XZG5_9GAMM|nr:hypothetical protein [Pseudidiomarina halophila]RUO54024.1 hypothetical protein CWI69_00910 [Pseudidiomarina halophila]